MLTMYTTSWCGYCVRLKSQLKRYGVTFAIEHGTDGTRTFHVQGKDVQVVEHALSVASERIDQKIARNATRRHNAEKIEEGVRRMGQAPWAVRPSTW